MLTDLPNAARQQNRSVHVWASNTILVDVMKFHPSYSFPHIDVGVVNPFLCDILRLRELYDCGNGHQIQQWRRAWGLSVDLKPKGVLNRVAERVKNRVILHFEPSAQNVSWQRQHWHPRMRELYPESKIELEKFIRSRNDLEFIQVGKSDLGIYGARYQVTPTIEELIKLIQSGEWFIGIMSGPLHVAVASDLHCVVLVNHPPARKVILPTLKWTGTPEEEWHYPQNVHLHQEGDTPLVPKVSKEALLAAFSGDVYPFWLDDWLGLINDKL